LAGSAPVVGAARRALEITEKAINRMRYMVVLLDRSKPILPTGEGQGRRDFKNVNGDTLNRSPSTGKNTRRTAARQDFQPE
jgi:hypothetical protein